ncbi:MAG: hypothetical protein FGM32_09415 [Candidatus Kapabacteria bacterium]|nr:hypothetical protein [Candidatus Kapabacteria bacterium]
MNEKLQNLAEELQEHTQRTTRTLLETQLEVDAICNSLKMMLEAIEQGTYEGKHDQASVSEMIKIATGIRDQVATFFDDLFVLNRDLASGIALERFENIEEVLKNSARFSERIDLFWQEVESLRVRLSGSNDSTEDDVTVDVSTYPPIPDLSKFDFKFRPVVKPKRKKDIDEEDPFSVYHEVAYYELPATMHDDLLRVYCHVEKKKDGTNSYLYFIANEYYEQDDGPSGERMMSLSEPMTFDHLILILEMYDLNKYSRDKSLCDRLYDALEDETLPIAEMPEMEIGSTMYPQLTEFYKVLFEYLRCWLNERSEMPELEEFLAVVDHFTDHI